MSESVEVPENPTLEELREAAEKADRIAEHMESEARGFRNLAAHLRARGVQDKRQETR